MDLMTGENLLARKIALLQYLFTQAVIQCLVVSHTEEP
jgi:hypothetical protein